MNRNVGDGLGLAAGIAELRVAGHADRLGLLQRPDNVRRISRTRHGNKDVALARQHRQLQRKHLIVAFVVGQTGNHRGIGRERMHAQSRPRGLRQRIQKIVGEVIGVSATAAVAGKEHLPPGLPAIEQFIGQALDRSPVKPFQRGVQTGGVIAEKPGRRGECAWVHFTTSLSIHFRLYQRSSFLSCPCEYMPMISLMASSTVFFGRKPVASNRSELTWLLRGSLGGVTMMSALTYFATKLAMSRIEMFSKPAL